MLTLGLILLLFAGLVALLVLSFIRVTIDADETGASICIAWLGSQFRFNTRTRRFAYSLFSKKLFERSLVKSKKRRIKKPKPKKRSKVTIKDARALMKSGFYFIRHLKLRYLRVRLVVASSDPALTGELYGYLTSLTSSLNAQLPKASFDVRPDFFKLSPYGQLASSVDIFVARLLAIAWQLGKYMIVKRRASKRLKGERYATPRIT